MEAHTQTSMIFLCSHPWIMDPSRISSSAGYSHPLQGLFPRAACEVSTMERLSMSRFLASSLGPRASETILRCV